MDKVVVEPTTVAPEPVEVESLKIEKLGIPTVPPVKSYESAEIFSEDKQ